MTGEPEAGAREPTTSRTGPRGLPAVTFQWWEAMLAYVVGNLLLGGLAYVATGAGEGAPPERLVVGTLALDLVFLASLLVWLRNVHPGSWAAIGLAWRTRAVAAGAALGALVYAVTAGGAALVLRWLYEQVAGHPVEVPEQMPGGLSDGGTVLFVVLAVAVAPVIEELFFRGIFYRSLRDRYGILAGLAGSAAMFGLVHYQAGPLADSLLLQSVMVLTGVGLALIYEFSGTLLASIAAHMAFNVIGVTLILRS